MASAAKAASELARILFRASFDQGALSPALVGGVLEYVEKHHAGQATRVLQAYARLVAAEEARHRAVVEHAGALPQATANSLAESLGRQYGRKVTVVTQPNPQLIAGLRVRIGDDIYESSVTGQLAELSAGV